MEITNGDNKGICHRHTQNSMILMITYFEERMWYRKSAENTDIRSMQFILVHLNCLISSAKNLSFRAHKTVSSCFMGHSKFHSKTLTRSFFYSKEPLVHLFWDFFDKSKSSKGLWGGRKNLHDQFQQVIGMINFGPLAWYLHNMLSKYAFLLPVSESSRWQHTTNTIYLNSCG